MNPAETVLVASDIHLGAISSEQEHAFMVWLQQAAQAASWIVLNGDLFDFWFEYRRGHTRGHGATLERLREIVDAGVRVTLMGGNHDWWGGTHLRDDVGLDFRQDPLVTDVAGLRTLLAHGDGLGRGDLEYRAMRLLFRSLPTRWAFGMLPPRVGDRLARVVSQTERRWGEPGPSDLARSEALREWALGELERRPELDLILLGHTHVPTMLQVDSGQWYINTGDWVYHRSYAVLEKGQQPKLVEWKGEIS